MATQKRDSSTSAPTLYVLTGDVERLKRESELSRELDNLTRLLEEGLETEQLDQRISVVVNTAQPEKPQRRPSIVPASILPPSGEDGRPGWNRIIMLLTVLVASLIGALRVVWEVMGEKK